MEPLVSIIMPNYNSDAYVGDTIRSVLSQTYTNFEFIIVDDASTDASRDIISSFGDNRIRLISKEKNENMCRALNTGIEYVRGSYIARIDNDDKWKPDKLKKQIEFLESNQEYGACFTWTDIIDENGNVIVDEANVFYSLFRQKNRTRAEWIRRLLFGGNCLCHPSVVVRAELVAQLKGYKDSLLQLQDYDMWLRLLKLSNIYVLEEALTEYRRIDEDNISISAKSDENDTRCYNETVYILESYLEDIDDELFVSAFNDYFVNKESSTESELACEKAFLLCRIGQSNAGREVGIRKLEALIDDSNCRSILENKFSFDCKSFYELNKEHYYFDCIIRENNDTDIIAEPAIYYISEDTADNFVMVSQKVHVKNGVLECSFEIPSKATIVRFDPVDNRSCIVTDIRILNGDKELDCEPVNGQISEGIWVFSTKDPQIIITVPEGFDGNLKIEAKIFTTSSELFLDSSEVFEKLITENKYYSDNAVAKISELESCAQNYSDMVEAKDNHIFNLENIIAAKTSLVDAKEQHIRNLEQHIINLEQHIQNLEQTINEMENTKVWKLYRKVKKD